MSFRSKMSSDLIEQVIEDLKLLHHKFQKNNKEHEIFNYSKVKKLNKTLSSRIDRCGIKWIELIILCGMNPKCHISQLNYGKSIEERKETFKQIIPTTIHIKIIS
jgi:hypothetical protein